MNVIKNYLVELYQASFGGWKRFWFTPSAHETLCLIRILTGLMLVYTHLVWTFDLEGFFGANGRISDEFVQAFHESSKNAAINGAWTYLYGLDGAALWSVHLTSLAVLVLFTIGLYTRVTAVLAFLITVSYANRAAGTLYGLDQINAMLSMYLMLGPCGNCYSVDAWLARRKGRTKPTWTTMGNISIRLMQIHLCVIYFFAGIGKLLGGTWWEGTALWGAFANYEYQTIDMTWLAGYPIAINILSQFTVLWEMSYAVFVWPRLTRPIVVSLSIPLHLGIALCMGMTTFGLIMIVANVAFLSPDLVRSIMGRFSGRSSPVAGKT